MSMNLKITQQVLAYFTLVDDSSFLSHFKFDIKFDEVKLSRAQTIKSTVNMFTAT